MQLNILTSILQSRVWYAEQSRILGQVQQQPQINSVLCNNDTATSSLCVLCSRRGIVDYDVIYSSTYRRGLITSQVLRPEMESRTQGSRTRPRTQKKIRGQGQSFREQTLSRPRTGMLEAKDQGHSRKCSQKKGLQKRFSGDLQFIGVSRIFDWGRPKPQITCYDVIKNF